MRCKKIVIIVLCVVSAALLAGVVLMKFLNAKTPVVRDFEISDYQYYLDNFPSSKTLGPILNAEDAIKKAEKIWVEVYGLQVKREKPYQVFFDAKNEIWLVTGSLRFYSAGGVANILIQRDTGSVLAIWHDK